MNRLNWCLLIVIICLASIFTGAAPTTVSSKKSTDQSFTINPLVRSVGIPITTPELWRVEKPDSTFVTEHMQFFGDILLGRNVERLISLNSVDYPFVHSHELRISATGPVFANFEAAVPVHHVPTPDFNTKFSVQPQLLALLPKAGITHVTLANNHSFDYGSAGYHNTLDSLAKVGIIGFGNPNEVASTSVTYSIHGEFTIAVIALSAVFFDPRDEALQALLDDVVTKSDIQIAYVHWGNEYAMHHSAKQENLAKKLASLGTDVIIGHHPHVVQDIQIVAGIPVFYSLGNYVFDQYFSPEVQTGLSVSLEIKPQELEFTLLPFTSIGTRSQPHKMNTEENTSFLENLAARSDSGQAQNILKNKVIVPFLLATTSKISMI